MMNSSECCAGSHQGEPRRCGFYSCIDGAKKTYFESGIKAGTSGFARRSAASKKSECVGTVLSSRPLLH
jgi:hypothetical protein